LRAVFTILNQLQRPFAGHAWKQPRRIVVIKPCCLGDVIMTTPLLESIQQAYPAASLTYLTGTWSKVVPEHHPAVSHVVDIGSIGIPGRYRLQEVLQLARQLRRQHYDLAFVLDRSPMLTLLPWLAGIPRRVGPDSLGRGFSLTDRVPVSSSPEHLQHQADIYLELARAIGIPVQQPHMRFEPTPAEQEEAASRPYFNDKNHLHIAMLIGGGSNPGMQLSAKRWPLERYRELLLHLVYELDASVLLVGGPDDSALNEQLFAGLTLPRGRVTNIAGTTTIGQLAACFARCDLFIGNDSGPMHLATAVGIPILAIFGPTSPEEYGPYPLDDPGHLALWKHPAGRPCFFLGKMQTCDVCTCMQSVSVDDVWNAVQQLIPGTTTEVRP
jgi:lipopolysaccharide heptosyltransferase II